MKDRPVKDGDMAFQLPPYGALAPSMKDRPVKDGDGAARRVPTVRAPPLNERPSRKGRRRSAVRIRWFG